MSDELTLNESIQQELVVLNIKEIQPYDGNPRRITSEAVAAVKESIQRYGYQQPIVVDSNFVIVVGHTRFTALKELGYTEIPVYVTNLSEDQAQQYRLIDNRTGEMSGWDYTQLMIELREWEQPLLDQYFPDVDLEIVSSEDSHVTQQNIDEAIEDIARVPENKDSLQTIVVCPNCFAEFPVMTASLPGLNRLDIAELNSGGPQ
jgi:hypothetical protein